MSLNSMKDYSGFILFATFVIMWCVLDDVAMFTSVVYSFLIVGFISAGNGLLNMVRDLYLYVTNVQRFAKTKKLIKGELENES